MRVAAATEAAPPPAGPYSQAAKIGRLVTTAGQVGRTRDGRTCAGIDDQTHQALSNLMAVLDAAGAAEVDVLSVRVYLTDQDNFAAMNRIYMTFFSEPHPARTTVYVGLNPGLLIEVDAFAYITPVTR